jgi:hypothetical protein
MRLRRGASGAEKLCALGAIGRFRAAPQLHSKDFPVVSTVSGVLVRSTAEVGSSEKDRLRHSNRPLVSALHSGPRVSRTLAPRSLGSVFRSAVDLVPRAPV